MTGLNGGLKAALPHRPTDSFPRGIATPLAAALSLTAATPGFAADGADTYACVFHTECIATRPCDTDFDLTARLRRDTDGWRLTLPGDEAVALRELSAAGKATRHLVTAEIDPAADAAALLTITKDGTAMLSTHGNFPSPSAVTHLGSCIAEAQ